LAVFLRGLGRVRGAVGACRFEVRWVAISKRREPFFALERRPVSDFAVAVVGWKTEV
jgi:hypothetical protein